MSAASWIRAGLALRGLTQSQLARKANIADRTLTNWLAGKSEPRWSDIEAIMAALDLGDPFTELAAVAGEEPRIDSWPKRALSNGHRSGDARLGGILLPTAAQPDRPPQLVLILTAASPKIPPALRERGGRNARELAGAS